MDLPTIAFDSFKVEEAYNWRDDVMEITRRIVHETDEARLSNIANHFEVDLSEIRAFLEMRQHQQRKPQTNAGRIRAMSDEEMAEFWGVEKAFCPPEKTVLSCLDEDMKIVHKYPDGCINCWLDWLKGEVKDDH